MRLSVALDFFLNHCYLKGLEQKSIDNYEEFVRRFIIEIGDIDLSSMNREFLETYSFGLYKRNLSKATIGTYLRHLKVFIHFLEKEKYLEKVSDFIIVPRAPKKVVKIYGDDEIKLIFETIDIGVEWLRYRNCTVVALMLDSGVRMEEVCEIDLKDYDFKQNLLLIHGKGNKERLVPVGKITRYYLKKYITSLPKYIHDRKEDGALFVNRNGERITRNTIKLMMQRLSERLPFSFSSHRLRHNFATNYCIDEYLKSGHVDLYKLMILLGHEDIKTTRRYLHLANQIIVAKSNISHLDVVFSGTV